MTQNVVYGPVPSRRLGRSLGVDLVPYKICSYDCIYCQIGRTPQPTMERKPYVPVEKVVRQVLEKLEQGVAADYITLGGSGEPTLNSDIAEIIARIQAASPVPVAVLTNGSMLIQADVRQALKAADAVLPSFDAPDADIFQRINRPGPGIGFAEMAEGMVRFRQEYTGPIWLEIFLIDGINTSEAAIEGFKHWMTRIRPDRIHLNTAVRPTAESGVLRPSDEQLMRVRDMLGERAEIVVAYQGESRVTGGRKSLQADLLDLLSRRPCTLSDIADGLDTHPHEILKYLEPLVASGEIEMVRKEDGTYYQKKLM